MLDLTNVEEQEFEPVPVGEYPSFIDEAEIKTSAAGNEYLKLKFKLIGDNYANRIVFNNLNLFHPTEKVRNIALGELKKMLKAGGFSDDGLKFESRESLLEALQGLNVKIKLTIKGDDYGLKNIIKGYSPVETASPSKVNEIPF